MQVSLSKVRFQDDDVAQGEDWSSDHQKGTSKQYHEPLDCTTYTNAHSQPFKPPFPPDTMTFTQQQIFTSALYRYLNFVMRITKRLRNGSSTGRAWKP